MICGKPKCRNKSDDPMVVCWICDTIYHAKCVDLAPRTADNLREDKGLRWCCKKCVTFDVEFYSFIRNTRDDLNNLNNDLNNFMQKFLKYKELFEKAPCSPKRKKTSAASSSNFSSTTSVTTSVNSISSQLSSTCGSTATVSSLSQSLITENNTITVSSVSPICSSNVLTIAPSQNLITTPSLTPQEVEQPLTPTIQKQSTPNSRVNVNNFPSGSSNTIPANNPESNPGNSVTLKVITPKKTIFAARFASETTTDAIKQYINYKLGYEIDITVFKFKYSEKRSKASFKIIVPEENFNTIINTDFWPPKAIIHEYIYRNTPRSDIVYLPSQENIPKN